MDLIYILSILLIIAFCLFIFKKINISEGFDTYYKSESSYTTSSSEKFGDRVNKALIVNSGLKAEIEKLGGSLNLSDVFANRSNKKTDFSKFFIADPIPGLEEENLQCSSALEPQFLPKRDSTSIRGCGWWYSDNDEYQSVGALGTVNNPLIRTNLEQSVPGGEWIWNLELAQKKELAKRCRRVKTCDMADLDPGKCGFCIERNSGIPVDSAGQSLYPDDPEFMCETVVTKPNKCPRPELIPDGTGKMVAPSALCDPDPTSGQLAKECLISLAKGVGLTNSGAIIIILLGDSVGYYDPNGDNNKLFMSALDVLQNGASISSPEAFFGYGPCSREEALRYYNTIYKTMSSGKTPKVRNAAKFLATGNSDFDYCPDEDSAYGPFDISCLERVALEAGCQPDGTDYPKMVQPIPNNAPAFCKKYGRPNEGGGLRIYSQNECDALNGNFHGNGECTKKEGGSFSWECRELNSLSSELSAKERYDGMKWGDVVTYFSDLKSQMLLGDTDKKVAAAKKCLGVDIVVPPVVIDVASGVYCYCYRWDYDTKVIDGRAPRSLFYGRFVKTSMPDFNNNGEFTPFGLGTERIFIRMRTILQAESTAIAQIWVLTDDGVSIQADDKNILQKWYDQGPTEYVSSQFVLRETNPTMLQINYYNNGGGYTFVPRIKTEGAFVKIPDTLIFIDQPKNFPFARWDFYEGKIEDRCNNLASEVFGNIPIGAYDGKKCAIFEGQNYIQILNGISCAAFKSISMMVYIRDAPPGWPRLWEFNNTKLGGSSCEDSLFGLLSPNNMLGIGFYVQKECAGPLAWSGGHTTGVGNWYHIVWAIDTNQSSYAVYLNGGLVINNIDENMVALLKNKIYKNMYIVNSVEQFDKNIGVAWFRMFDYTMTSEDVKTDMANGWSTNKLFPKSLGTGW